MKIHLRRPATIVGYALGVMAASASITSDAVASEPYPVDLEACVDSAGLAFAGTVVQSRAVKVPGTIVTRFEFSDIRVARGKVPGRTVELSLLGGRIGELSCGAVGMPTFVVGGRYVVLCKADLGSEQNHYAPIVFYNQGVFPVRRRRSDGPMVVHDPYLRPIVGYRSGHLVVARSDSSRQGSHDNQLPPNPDYSGRNEAARGMTSAPRAEITMEGQIAYEILPGAEAEDRLVTEEEFLEIIRGLAKGK